MANVTTTPCGTLILDTAATIFATGAMKVKVRGFTFTGTVGELQDGAGRPVIRVSGGASAWFADKPIILDGLIVAGGITGVFTLFVG